MHGKKIVARFGFQFDPHRVQESRPFRGFSRKPPMRSILIVLDSLGIGAAPDADRYGDWGADTLGHLFAQQPELSLPALFSLGLGHVLSGGSESHGIRAAYGRMRPAAAGKDSVSGHWEMAGVITRHIFTVHEKLPLQLVEAIEAAARVQFLISDGVAENDAELWKTHATSVEPVLRVLPGESAFEILAHETVLPRRRLYEIARIARRYADAHGIARVIAQPLIGKPRAWRNGPGRHEYTVTPPRTVLNAIAETGLMVEGIGKVPDLFARSGITHPHAAADNTEALALVEHTWEHLHDGLVFANLPDFDRMGHARDVPGYAAALTTFDKWLADFLPNVGRDELLIITADHGNDPAFRGTDHTREEVPLLAHYDGVTGPLGTRDTLADIAATLSGFFQLKESWKTGHPFLNFKTTKPMRSR
jgi:phosphopentomutase